MRKLVIAGALASTMIAAPALARDGSPYVGVEGGVLRAQDTEVDYSDADDDILDALTVDHKLGFDVDLIAGYDFGAFRAEAEFGYKRASADNVRVDPALFATPIDSDFDGKTRILSAMANALLDFGGDDGLSGFLGGGVGIARTKIRADLDPFASGFRGTDRGFAWQVLAGVRAPVSDNIDLGLKYRFFNTKFDFSDGDAGAARELDGKFRSHSLLASLIFNFGAPVAPPLPPAPPAPPPPPPPPTQTCPDGSVILSTDSCPVPPPPPPPPPPAPERG